MAHPKANFHDSFEGTTGNGYGLANAIVKVNFAYAGYTNAFNVVNEVKVCHRTPFRIFSPINRPSESHQSIEKDGSTFTPDRHSSVSSLQHRILCGW